jgi:PDZ domain-containing secreted protein
MPLQRVAIRTRRYEIYDAIGTISSTVEFTDLTQQSCILADVLAHRINVSYDNFKGEVIKAVNGTTVKNMRHLVELLSAVKTGETTIDFDCGKSESRAHCVFDTVEAKECEEEILGLNKVPSWCSPELMQ